MSISILILQIKKWKYIEIRKLENYTASKGLETLFSDLKACVPIIPTASLS